MEPEQDDGNIEYKRNLFDNSTVRVEGLATQMRYRCEEGDGECIYNIGVDDDGTIVGITPDDYDRAINILNSAAAKNKCVVTLLSTRPVEEGDGKNIYEVLVREHNEDKYIDIKIAVAGNVDSGKSSLIGVLANGKLDDGKGSSRLSVFNYPHEVKTGRTSSIGHQILGFDTKGDIVNYQGFGGKMSWPEIVRRSAKIISMHDLAGHEKYLKTTILGLASSNPDMCLIIVGANKGIRNEKNSSGLRNRAKSHENMTKEHIFLCITLGIPFAIIVTKIDMVKEQGIENVYEKTMEDIQRVIKHPGIRRQPIRVENDDDILICARQVHTESVVPIFSVSNVTGQGIDHVKKFLNVLGKINPKYDTEQVEYHIDSTWSIAGIGTVVGGHLISGTIKVNDKLWIGPNNGKYEQVIVRSIHCKRVSVQRVARGSYVCMALKKYDRNLVRRGNVIVSNISQKICTNEFVADIKVMKSHSTTIRVGYEPVIHASVIRQTATLTHIENKMNSRDPDSTKDDNILRTGDTATATFRFRYHSEFLIPGMRILLNEGRTKCIGVVKTVR